jgi:uncharacterized protein (DUF433 family)
MSGSILFFGEGNYVGIVRRPNIMGGSPTIAGTRVRVADIISLQHVRGKSVTTIRRALPHLTTAQVKMALEYYQKHRTEIDDEIRVERALSNASAAVPRRARSIRTRSAT